MSTSEAKTPAPMTAGQSVWILLNRVKADKREQFERFNRDILWPAIQQGDVTRQQTGRQTRVLHPTDVNEDGTYTYVYLIDPVVEGADYDIEKLLKQHLGEEQGARTFQLFTECFDRPQEGYSLIEANI